MKKIFLAFFAIFFLVSLFLPLIVSGCEEFGLNSYMADDREICYAGLIPCGKSPHKDLADGESQEVKMPCQLCHFFVMLTGIINFILFTIVPPVAVLMVVIGGVMFFLAVENPQNVNKAKSVLKAIIFGLILIYGSWLIVNFVLTFPGLVNPSFSWDPRHWFIVNCPISLEGHSFGPDCELIPMGPCPPSRPNLIPAPPDGVYCCP